MGVHSNTVIHRAGEEDSKAPQAAFRRGGGGDDALR